MDLRTTSPGITAPTLAIAGADDPATPPSHLEAIAAGVPDGRLLVVPEAAHLANAEQPQAITPALHEHLEGAVLADYPAHEGGDVVDKVVSAAAEAVSPTSRTAPAWRSAASVCPASRGS